MTLHLVASAANEAAEAGLNLLDRRAVTESQMRDYLGEKGFSPEAVQEAVTLFGARGWLDDHDYATELIRQRASKAGLSRARLRADMEKRGLEAETIEVALAKCDEESPDWETENARIFLKGKLGAAKRGLDVDSRDGRVKLQAKLWRYLATRGFDSALVGTLVRETMEELERESL